MLTLEIEYLTGVCFAARSQASDKADFPPQPDRVFSALVAAWGSRGESPNEKAALEWLERQDPPEIAAGDHFTRRVGISFVPPNDASNQPQTMPDRRRRQPRMFPAAIPHSAGVRFIWTAAPDEATLTGLQALARDTAYLGHSASVVRCRFTVDEVPDTESPRQQPKRSIYPGRFEALQRAYRMGERPLSGEPIAPLGETNGPPFASSLFSSDWIVLEDAGGQCPDLRGIAIIARRLRDALMSHYGAEALVIDEVISGHKPDGSPTSRPHLAIVPLADVGQTQYSDGRLMGVGLVLPRDLDEERSSAEDLWLAGLDDPTHKAEKWLIFDRMLSVVSQLKLGQLGVWAIARTLAPSKTALQPERYCAPAKRWSTVTPIVLDRFPKGGDPGAREEEIRKSITLSCTNIGLPAPAAVRIHKHGAVKGTPSAYPSGKAPAWTGWTLPRHLAGRPLTHATIEFAEPLAGPVILGAGRFAGLGLCLGVRA